MRESAAMWLHRHYANAPDGELIGDMEGFLLRYESGEEAGAWCLLHERAMRGLDNIADGRSWDDERAT